MDKKLNTTTLSMSMSPDNDNSVVDDDDHDDDRMYLKTLQEALHLTMSLPMEKDIRRRMDIELIWSQIQLIYRAEGNANLVIALPQFSKILRLPKWQQIPMIEQDIPIPLPKAGVSMSLDHAEGLYRVSLQMNLMRNELLFLFSFSFRKIFEFS